MFNFKFKRKYIPNHHFSINFLKFGCNYIILFNSYLYFDHCNLNFESFSLPEDSWLEYS